MYVSVCRLFGLKTGSDGIWMKTFSTENENFLSLPVWICTVKLEVHIILSNHNWGEVENTNDDNQITHNNLINPFEYLLYTHNVY